MYAPYAKRDVAQIYLISLSLAVIAVVTAILSHNPALYLAAPVLLFTGFLVALFYRHPKRTVILNDRHLLSPADGTIADITDVELEGQAMTRVGIFLSVLSVHINRAPCRLTVQKTQHKPGAFHGAMLKKAVTENESLLMSAVNSNNEFIAVRQVSGALARRIVCAAQEGEKIEQGEPYGMIKLGSRTELFFPKEAGYQVGVRVGQKVAAGLTVIAKKG